MLPLPIQHLHCLGVLKAFQAQKAKQYCHGVFVFKNKTKTHDKSEFQCCFQSLPSVGQGGLFWVYLNSTLEDGEQSHMLGRDRYWCSSAGMQCWSCQPPSSPLGCNRAQTCAAGSPLGQQQLETFCSYSL